VVVTFPLRVVPAPAVVEKLLSAVVAPMAAPKTACPVVPASTASEWLVDEALSMEPVTETSAPVVTVPPSVVSRATSAVRMTLSLIVIGAPLVMMLVLSVVVWPEPFSVTDAEEVNGFDPVMAIVPPVAGASNVTGTLKV